MAFDSADFYRTLAPYAEQVSTAYDRIDRVNSLVSPTLKRHTAYDALDSLEFVEGTMNSIRSSLLSSAASALAQMSRILIDRDLVTQYLPVPTNATSDQIYVALQTLLDAAPVTSQNLKLTDFRGAGSDVITELISSTYLAELANFNLGFLRVIDPDATLSTQVLVVPFLDGVSSPRANVPSSVTHFKEVTQLAPTKETLRVAVQDDSVTGGQVRNQEPVQLFGVPQSVATTDNPTQPIVLRSAYRNGLFPVFNPNTTGFFSAWTDGVPVGWELVSGTATGSDPGDDTFDDDKTTAEFYQKTDASIFGGVNTLFIKAAGTTVQLRYPIAATNFVRRGLYVLSWWEKATAADNDVTVSMGLSATPGQDLTTLDLKFTAPGEDAVTQTMLGGTAYGSLGWRLKTQLFSVEDTLTLSTYYINIVKGTNTGGADTEYTGFAITPVEYHAGLGWVVLPGPNLARTGDAGEVAVEQNTKASGGVTYGKWAKVFARGLGRQLPVKHVVASEAPDTYLNTENLTTVP